MSLFHYLKRQRSLLAELEAARAENAQLRYNLTTAWLASWIRSPATPPEAATPPESSSSIRADPHAVNPGRHHREEPPTEVHPRAVLRRNPK